MFAYSRYLAASLIFLAACGAPRPTATDAPASQTIAHGKLFASAFQQRAAEYRALCYQAYNLARLQLKTHLQAKYARPMAIITDIDETVLDNSPYDVHQALRGRDHEPEVWYDWTSRAMADTVPGALSFLKEAAASGVTIFYITNRDEREREGTLKNLQRFGFPLAAPSHLILRKDVSSKEGRRQAIAATHEIIMIIGDNLGDFSALFDKKSLDVREQNTKASAHLFGERFIVLPNPVYGDWESALYNYNRYTPAQKDSALRSLLKDY